MKLLVGLGNPGPTHARQRHNVGFMALDAIVARFGIGPLRRRFHGEAAEGRIGNKKVLVLKPQTFMNESGRAVGEAVRFYKLDLGDVIVLHDEIDLAAGKVRVKRGGGAAGHNGLKSITSHLGPDFVRVRIGIGHPGSKHRVQRHVLGDFSKADAAWLDPLLEAIAASAERLVVGDDANFMNEVARSARPADGEAQHRPSAPVPPKRKPARAPASTKGKAPSQRDLARAAAARSAPKRRKGDSTGAAQPTPPTPADRPAAPGAPGPFSLLRRLFSPGRDADGG